MGKQLTEEELKVRREAQAKFRAENPEKAKAQWRKDAAKQVKKRLTDPIAHEKYKQYLREYHRKNKDRLAQKKSEYLAKKRLDSDFVETKREKSRNHYHSLRRAALDHYGWKCACCGESIEQFLSIDHINNDGAQHRKQMNPNSGGNGKGTSIYGWLKKNNYPEGFQTLCMNCNHGKARNGGICPHISTVKEQ